MWSIVSPLCAILLVSVSWIPYIYGHGMMLVPSGRASRWRFNDSAPVNYNDMEAFCGGLTNTWKKHGGKCGICGDDYGMPTPRPHELGGEFGEGHVVATYPPGGQIPISVKLIANHRGYFVFDVCNLDREPETEECFKRLKLSDGNDQYDLKYFRPSTFNMTVQVPHTLNCEHCVLRWHYKSANMWGTCENGTSTLGCGPQEIYRSCADISVKRQTHW